MSHRLVPTRKAGSAKMKKEARHESNKVAMPRAIAGVSKKLALPPVKCIPKALPLLSEGKTWEMKDEAGAWYVPPINPMAIKYGTICQKAWVQLTPMPAKDMPNNPNTIMRRRLKRSARMAMGTCPSPKEILKEDTNIPD
jgi:hypothetical protein